MKIIQLNGLVIHWETKRVRNMNLRVRKDGTIWLSTPYRASEAQVKAWLMSKEAWIRQAVMHTQQAKEKQPEACSWADGEIHPLWGKAYALRLERSVTAKKRQARIENQEIILTLRPQDGPDQSEKLYWELLTNELQRELAREAAAAEKLTGCHPARYVIKNMKSRWGSCTPANGHISICLRLAQYPPQCLHYVVIHELVHLLEPSHNKRFYAFVSQFDPNYQEAVRLLKSLPQI